MPGTFNVDHGNMDVGIYNPGSNIVGDMKVVTLDVRVTQPYKEEVVKVKELHTVEHILAVEIEKACKRLNDKGEFPIEKIYWGPMGCQTGFYLLVGVRNNEQNEPAKVCEMLQDACRQVLTNPFYMTPANSKEECGNNRTLFSTSREVTWVLRRIYDACESVMFNNEYFKYKYL